jgi:hypothetical protein
MKTTKTRKQQPGNPELLASMDEFLALHATGKAANPDHLAARASEALALRLLSRYHDARDSVEFYGGDVSTLPATPSHAEIDERYWELLRDEVLDVRPDTASSELRYIDLIEAIIADRLLPHDAPVVSDEQDLGCALQMLRSVHSRANDRDIAEGLAQQRAKAGKRP